MGALLNLSRLIGRNIRTLASTVRVYFEHRCGFSFVSCHPLGCLLKRQPGSIASFQPEPVHEALKPCIVPKTVFSGSLAFRSFIVLAKPASQDGRKACCGGKHLAL